MKKDLDALMQDSNIDVLLVTGPAQHNPAMVYLTGGGHMTQADLIKKRGEPAILFHGSMEREEAVKTGLKACSYSNYPWGELFKAANGDRLTAAALRYQRMLQDLGITQGIVALYGQVEIGRHFSIMSKLQEMVPGITFIGYQEEDLLMCAMMTKDADEMNRIRHMGQITTNVVGMTADFLTGHKTRDDILIKSNGDPLTIGDVKRRINLWLAEEGAENPEDTIFAIGHDAGVPHSSGNPEDVLRLGSTIVFDIFPCEKGGGYFYDFTRTWCLGYAPDEAQKLYEDVLSVYKTIESELKVGTRFADYQKRTCDLFEGLGHPTVQSVPETEVGYVHSLGHGVGLHVHEMPFSGNTAGTNEILVPGAVFTMEPGLYYPERGMGMRLENTLGIMPDGSFVELAPEFPMDLILPMKG
jgi:Xaa-Pro aminopeptidase